MSHELEIINGQASMAWAGEVPWHGLGKKVPSDLTPEQMLEAAQLDWEVSVIPTYANIGGVETELPRSALVRSTDNRVLDVISNDWVPCQNSTAFEFFNNFISKGDMTMETAGSLHDGRIIWALAKINAGFDLFGQDTTNQYLLFTNPHQYGRSIDIRTALTRVVCQNTMTQALGERAKNACRVNHRAAFNGDAVKEVLGMSAAQLELYREKMEFISSKRATKEDIVSYFNRVFPLLSPNPEEGKESKNSKLAQVVLETQPGAEFGEGTFYQAFQAVTFMNNHLAGRNQNNRLASNWYGTNSNINQKALALAVEMADA